MLFCKLPWIFTTFKNNQDDLSIQLSKFLKASKIRIQSTVLDKWNEFCCHNQKHFFGELQKVNGCKYHSKQWGLAQEIGTVKWKKSLDNKGSRDSSKAFDCLNHESLLAKINACRNVLFPLSKIRWIKPPFTEF